MTRRIHAFAVVLLSIALAAPAHASSIGLVLSVGPSIQVEVVNPDGIARRGEVVVTTFIKGSLVTESVPYRVDANGSTWVEVPISLQNEEITVGIIGDEPDPF